MKKKLFLFVTIISLVSCGASEETKKEDAQNENSSSNEEMEEDRPLTAENLIGSWTVSEFDSELTGAENMVGKTFTFAADSVNLFYISNEELKAGNCFYEIIDDATIKITYPLNGGGTQARKYTGFIGDTGLRLNSSQGSLLLVK